MNVDDTERRLTKHVSFPLLPLHSCLFHPPPYLRVYCRARFLFPSKIIEFRVSLDKIKKSNTYSDFFFLGERTTKKNVKQTEDCTKGRPSKISNKKKWMKERLRKKAKNRKSQKICVKIKQLGTLEEALEPNSFIIHIETVVDSTRYDIVQGYGFLTMLLNFGYAGNNNLPLSIC